MRYIVFILLLACAFDVQSQLLVTSSKDYYFTDEKMEFCVFPDHAFAPNSIGLIKVLDRNGNQLYHDYLFLEEGNCFSLDANFFGENFYLLKFEVNDLTGSKIFNVLSPVKNFKDLTLKENCVINVQSNCVVNTDCSISVITYSLNESHPKVVVSGKDGRLIAENIITSNILETIMFKPRHSGEYSVDIFESRNLVCKRRFKVDEVSVQTLNSKVGASHVEVTPKMETIKPGGIAEFELLSKTNTEFSINVFDSQLLNTEKPQMVAVDSGNNFTKRGDDFRTLILKGRVSNQQCFGKMMIVLDKETGIPLSYCSIDQHGSFSFSDLIFFGKRDLNFVVLDDSNVETLQLSLIKENSLKKGSQNEDTIGLFKVREFDFLMRLTEFDFERSFLAEVPLRNDFKSLGKLYKFSDYNFSGSFFEAVNNFIPNFKIQKKSNQYYYRILNPYNSMYFKSNPLIIINGRVVKGNVDLTNIDSENVESVRVINTVEERSHIGRYGATGILIITLKTGMDDLFANSNFFSQATHQVSGFLTPLKFNEKSNNLINRNSIINPYLYWNPYIKLIKNEKKKVEFKLPELTSSYVIQFKFISSSKEISYQNYYFNVD
jgi:hypothetical protein